MGRRRRFATWSASVFRVSEADAERGRIELKVTSQGCADSGVCYTPLEQTVSARLPSRSGGSSVAWVSTSVVSILAAVIALAAVRARMASSKAPVRTRGSDGVFRISLALRAPGLQAVALAVSAVAILGVGGGLPDVFRMLAWAAWLIIAAVLLRATDPLPPGLPASRAWVRRLALSSSYGGYRCWLAQRPALPTLCSRSPLCARRQPRGLDSCPGTSALRASGPRPPSSMPGSPPREGPPCWISMPTGNLMQEMEHKAALKRYRIFGPPGIVLPLQTLNSFHLRNER